jgi:raffinose/stachyose/melibiose transport system substrate-binding protein
LGLLATSGLLYPMDSFYETFGWKDKAFDWAVDWAVYDGKVWGVAHEVEYIGPLYNVDIFEQLGLKEPDTYAEFVDNLRKLKAADYVPIALGTRDKFAGGWIYSNFIEAAAGTQRVEDVLFGDGRWNQERFNDAAREMQNLVKEGLILKEANTLTADEAMALLWSGKAAMVVTGSWVVRDLIEHSDMRFANFHIPAIHDDVDGRYTGGIGSGMAISATTKHPELAAKFIDYALFQVEGQRIIFEEGNVIPAVEADISQYNIHPIFAEVIEEVNDPRGIGYNLSVVIPAQTKNVYYEAVQGIVGQFITPEQANGMIQSAWEKDKASGVTK